MKSKYFKPGDRVYSTLAKPPMLGTVLRVRADVGMPYYTIRWDNGVIGHAGLASSGLAKESEQARREREGEAPDSLDAWFWSQPK